MSKSVLHETRPGYVTDPETGREYAAWAWERFGNHQPSEESSRMLRKAILTHRQPSAAVAALSAG